MFDTFDCKAKASVKPTRVGSRIYLLPKSGPELEPVVFVIRKLSTILPNSCILRINFIRSSAGGMLYVQSDFLTGFSPTGIARLA